jgi:hypothetical protein
MSFMIEVLYHRPRNLDRERVISEIVAPHGGRFDYFEDTNMPGISETITLTFVFDVRAKAEEAATALISGGHHVEGVCDY